MGNSYKILIGISEGKRLLGVYGRIILIWMSRTQCEGMDLIHMAQEREQWGVPLNTVMNPRVP
jgi:hypothetical protein